MHPHHRRSVSAAWYSSNNSFGGTYTNTLQISAVTLKVKYAGSVCSYIEGCACDGTVLIVRNRLGKRSSNLGRGCLLFTLDRVESSSLPISYRSVIGETGHFNYVTATGFWEGKIWTIILCLKSDLVSHPNHRGVG